MDTGGVTPATAVSPAKPRVKSKRMDRTERFYKIDHLIRERGIVPVQDFLRELEVSLFIGPGSDQSTLGQVSTEA